MSFLQTVLKKWKLLQLLMYENVQVNVAMVSVTPDEIVKGAHGISVLCDKNIVNCDFFDAEMWYCLADCLEQPLE